MNCARCDQRPRQVARGLCRPCYKMMARKHILHRYPLLDGELEGWSGKRATPEQKAAATSLVCVCSAPRRQRIPWFPGACQCGNCGRPFAADLSATG